LFTAVNGAGYDCSSLAIRRPNLPVDLNSVADRACALLKTASRGGRTNYATSDQAG